LESYDETLSRRAYLAVNQKLTLFKRMRLDFARRSILTKIFAKESGAAGCECPKNQEHGEAGLKF
jgi:hypothetical protein